ncbi:hypothetical protein CHMI_02927 [Cellulomonas hominis]|nr:hypothetical protein CHMI_02927 [Cellulomonas hominis]
MERDAPGERGARGPAAQLGLVRTGPGDRHVQPRVGLGGVEQHVEALVGVQEPADVAGARGGGRTDYAGVLGGAAVGAGVVLLRGGRLDAQPDDVRGRGQPLAAEHLAGLGVADADRAGAAQGEPLPPPERRRVPLVEVLRGVQDVRGADPAQRPEQQDLGGGERRGLLVQVQDVPVLAERPPDRPRVVEEHVRVRAEGADPDDVLARPRLQVDVAAALGPGARAERADGEPAGAQGVLPPAPRRDDGAVGDPQDAHGDHRAGHRDNSDNWGKRFTRPAWVKRRPPR